MVAASAALTCPAFRSWARSAARASVTSTANMCSTRWSTRCRRIRARSRRRRHLRCRADGRIRSQGTARRRHARRGHVRPQGFQPVIDAIIKLAEEKCAKEPRDFTAADHSELFRNVKASSATISRSLQDHRQPSARRGRCGQGQGEARPSPTCRRRGQPRWRRTSSARSSRSWKLRSSAATSSRPEPHRWPRSLTVRQIVSEVGVLPRTHGSALFTRGETQAIVLPPSAPARTSRSSTGWKAPVKTLHAALQLPALLGR
jgi:hypothetical protein